MAILVQKILEPRFAIAKHVVIGGKMMINVIKGEINAFLRKRGSPLNPPLLSYEKYDILLLVTQKSQIRKALNAYVLACESQVGHEQKDVR